MKNKILSTISKLHNSFTANYIHSKYPDLSLNQVNKILNEFCSKKYIKKEYSLLDNEISHEEFLSLEKEELYLVSIRYKFIKT